MLDRNATCSGSRARRGRTRRSRSYSCTKFTAKIAFRTKNGQSAQFEKSAGSAKGHNISVSRAKYKSGQIVALVYDPNDLSKVYVNSFFELWAIPLIIFVFSFFTFIFSFGSGKKRVRVNSNFS